MFAQKLEQRRKEFMRDCDPEEVKRRREKCMVELRSVKRQDRYLQKRGKRLPEPIVSEDTWERLVLECTQDCEYLPVTPAMAAVQRYECLLNTFRDTTDPAAEEDLLARIKVVVGEQDSIPLQYLVHKGLMPKLLKYLEAPKLEIALNAAEILVNLTFGYENSIFKAIVDEGGIELLIKLINTSPEEIADYCIWVLSNIAGERSLPNLRELMLEEGILEALQPLTDGLRARSVSLVENMCWLITNLVIDRYPLPIQYAEKLCWVLQRCFSTEDITAQSNCLASVYTLTKTESELLPIVRQAGLLQSSYAFLSHEVESLRLQAVQCIGNFITFAPDSAPQLLEIGLLGQLQTLLCDSSVEVQIQTLWLLSSLLVEAEHAQTLISHPIFPAIINSMTNPSSKVKQEAIVCIHNLTCARTVPIINSFINHNGIELLCQSLTFPDSKVLDILLGTLINTLEIAAGDMFQEVRDRLEPFVTGLDRLLEHRNVRIQDRVKRLYRLLDAQEAVVREEEKTPGVFSFS